MQELRGRPPVYLSSNGQCYRGFLTLVRVNFLDLTAEEKTGIRPLRRVYHRTRYNKYNADGSKK